MATPRLMVVLFAATGIVVAGVAALALQSWVLLFAVLALHGVATALVVAMAWRRAGDTREKPDPVTQARVEEEKTGGSHVEEEQSGGAGSYREAGAGTS